MVRGPGELESEERSEDADRVRKRKKGPSSRTGLTRGWDRVESYPSQLHTEARKLSQYEHGESGRDQKDGRRGGGSLGQTRRRETEAKSRDSDDDEKQEGVKN